MMKLSVFRCVNALVIGEESPVFSYTAGQNDVVSLDVVDGNVVVTRSEHPSILITPFGAGFVEPALPRWPAPPKPAPVINFPKPAKTKQKATKK